MRTARALRWLATRSSRRALRTRTSSAVGSLAFVQFALRSSLANFPLRTCSPWQWLAPASSRARLLPVRFRHVAPPQALCGRSAPVSRVWEVAALVARRHEPGSDVAFSCDAFSCDSKGSIGASVGRVQDFDGRASTLPSHTHGAGAERDAVERLPSSAQIVGLGAPVVQSILCVALWRVTISRQELFGGFWGVLGGMRHAD